MKSNSNKRIAKNTVFLYLRMLLLIAVNLYTSRIVLKELGIEDFGLYSIVGAIVSFLGFANASMTAAAQRFLSYANGTDDQLYHRATFNSVFWAQSIIAGIIFLAGETIGVVYISNYLNVDPTKIGLSHAVFQFALFSFLAKTVTVPYSAAIIANEKMAAFAILSIAEAILQLSVAVSLSFIGYNKLLFYSFGLFASVFCVQCGLRIYARTKFKECQIGRLLRATQIRKIFTYSGWNLLGTFSSVLIDQGVNMILNSFFGVVVNAARGIAFQVSAAIASLSGNFQQAMNPQIVKLYARKEITEMHALIMSGSKFSFYLLLLLSFPIFCNLHEILNLWLDDVPEYTELFCRLTIVNALISSLSGPILIGAMATGEIKKYQIIVATINMMNFPISYILLKFSPNPYLPMYVMISISVVAFITRLELVSKMLGFSKKQFTFTVIKPVSQVTIASILMAMVIMQYTDRTFTMGMFALNILICLLSITTITIALGLTGNERQFLQNHLQRILHL